MKWFDRVQFRQRLPIGRQHGVTILEQAMRSFDRAEAARKALDTSGTTFMDRFGQPRSHPDVVVERDHRAAMLAALGRLNIDVLPPEREHNR